MPIENNFQHDELSRKNPGDRLAYTDWTPPPEPGSRHGRKAWHRSAARSREPGYEQCCFCTVRFQAPMCSASDASTKRVVSSEGIPVESPDWIPCSPSCAKDPMA
ncbi:MAG: hypothetical protein UZ03_NOB001003535, partial [Nitrospira sp. OLB3]